MSTHYQPGETPRAATLKTGISYDGRPFSELKEEHQRTLRELACAARKASESTQSHPAILPDPCQPRPTIFHDRADARLAAVSEMDSANFHPSSAQQSA